MKRTFLFLVFAILIVSSFNFSVSAQSRTPEPQVRRDPVLEADALKNLQAARLYFTTKKAYRAVIMRCEEIIAANPEFSRMDEVLYLYSMSSLNLANGKGKQKIDETKLSEEDKKKYSPEKLREDAVANFNLLVQKFPNSEYKEKAEKILKEIDKN